MTFGIPKKSMELILQTLRSFPEINRAVIFGSRSKGNYKRGSDIDIAVFGKQINENTINELRIILNEELPLPYYFDIVNYETIKDEDLKQEIDKYGIDFYKKNP
ncbi:Nucleotidyltransferase domain-containing protein [Anaerobranca californiensis DSM 14826]|jgi:predicted nucleotidyltransferase|uniref:Nucleotidyltransferase domain-containing protein n=1 Tax=Anaerobranca californiensis DSM 14826 TaxID=1120989 RepID=A0A1M6RP88_9FIRM|nr:nucleotidyltransferase domain-containing protein [Anaerobranca californiensis]SHK34263.1 Nucleotidyltransferase domain-containing protein [Anaerobranca californiensis DSM 14826]